MGVFPIELEEVEFRGEVFIEKARALIRIVDCVEPFEEPPATDPDPLDFEALRPLVEFQAADVPGRQVAQIPRQIPVLAHGYDFASIGAPSETGCPWASGE